MMRHLKRVLSAAVLVGLVQQATAFSMLGPFAIDGGGAVWQTPVVGYAIGADLGGPMNLGEEYRWNQPFITYGFDESFINYFGSRGVLEVEKAVQVFNDLPPFSSMSDTLAEYPLDTRRFNHLAAALALHDLKSWTMSVLLEELGLACPERYVWTLRSAVDVPPWSFAVIQRSFDPVTLRPSSYVNGALYTYQILQTYTDPVWEAVEFEVDPTMPSVTSVAALSGLDAGTIGGVGGSASFQPGLFFTGLTRDDVGGLRHIYQFRNYNVESVATNAVVAPVGTTVPGNGMLTGGSGSPWGAPGGTNVAGTNIFGTNVLVNIALRPGIDKLTFVRLDNDSLTGLWLTQTNVWRDQYITNFALRSQVLQRTLARPDIVFTASDLGLAIYVPLWLSRTIPFVSQDTINGIETLSGPGLITPPIEITYTKLGPDLLHVGPGGQTDAFIDIWWSSYDGTTNAPVVYPDGTLIRELEARVLSGRADEGSNPWRAPGTP
ncbi:MAG: hypothetical protein FJ387_00555 [Verrucomicrobia bacterium]|nr:hypothetical protein [Verrucomicrobiota bacterium]